MSLNICSDKIFLTAKHFVAKLGTVMHCHEPYYRGERLVYCLQGQGQSMGTCDQNMTAAAISFNLLILLRHNLV